MPKVFRRPIDQRPTSYDPVHQQSIRHLHPGQASPSRRPSSTWLPQDDTILVQQRACGVGWKSIAERFPDKTSNACRKRHERLMDRRKGGEWSAAKLDLLCKAYVDVRAEMWTILAERTGRGEKWQMVEKKVCQTFGTLAQLLYSISYQCMERGLKPLVTHGNVIARRERQSGEASLVATGERGVEEHDDSGLGFMADAAEHDANSESRSEHVHPKKPVPHETHAPATDSQPQREHSHPRHPPLQPRPSPESAAQPAHGHAPQQHLQPAPLARPYVGVPIAAVLSPVDLDPSVRLRSPHAR